MRKAKRILQNLGAHKVHRFLLAVAGIPRYIADLIRFQLKTRVSAESQNSLRLLDLKPCLSDRTQNTGFDRHYVLFNAWAMRKLAQTNPTKHVDFSSTLYFCTAASAFVTTEFYDYRPALIDLPNLSSRHADLNNLPMETNSLPSISCMHVIEHIGLGRYGDPVNPRGDQRAIEELVRVTEPGGNIFIVVPVGRPRVMFNAHRIYDVEKIVSYFAQCRLVEFSLIEDDGGINRIIEDAEWSFANKQHYGCGLFWFKKNDDHN